MENTQWGEMGNSQCRVMENVITYTYFINSKIMSARTLFFFTGGEPGSVGYNFLKCANGRLVNLGAKSAVDIQPGVSRKPCPLS